MTDDTKKNVSMKYNDYELTTEELLGPRDTYTRMKCSKCGYEENVPDWVLGEFRGEDIASGHGDREVSTECPKCNGAMFKICTFLA